METLAVIKLTRAIRRLASAITPGTNPAVSERFIDEALEAITEARKVVPVVDRIVKRTPEFEPAPEGEVGIVRLDDAIARYCEALTLNGRCADSETVVYSPDPRGRKYTRIVRTTTAKALDAGHVRGEAHVTSRSVAAFVKREDGTIWKADGWKGPALNFPRGNVYKPDGYAAHMHGYGL